MACSNACARPTAPRLQHTDIEKARRLALRPDHQFGVEHLLPMLQRAPGVPVRAAEHARRGARQRERRRRERRQQPAVSARQKEVARIEAELQTHPFAYIPKATVATIEPKLQNGDIIGIVTNRQHVFCSHVGLALRSADGQCHFMHASLTGKKVLVDKVLHDYLAGIKSHAGIVVARPV